MKIKDGVEIAVPCKCREKAVMSRRLRFADIPEAFRGMDLRSFRMDVYRKPESKKMVSDACKIIKTYLDDFESQKISIHAPTRGATADIGTLIGILEHFNPRSYKRSDGKNAQLSLYLSVIIIA